jgi:hypothetical protein
LLARISVKELPCRAVIRTTRHAERQNPYRYGGNRQSVFCELHFQTPPAVESEEKGKSPPKFFKNWGLFYAEDIGCLLEQLAGMPAGRTVRSPGTS